jgi:hypothetical protein
MLLPAITTAETSPLCKKVLCAIKHYLQALLVQLKIKTDATVAQDTQFVDQNFFFVPML